MPSTPSTLLSDLTARGLVQDATPGLADRLARGPVAGYVGFDPTAPSLHVGNLVPVMGLAWLQRAGGTPLVVVGGGTGMVGDPSGKRSERPVLPVEDIDANAGRMREQLQRFLRFDGPGAARMFNNADWLRGLRLMDFLRDVGKHFTLSYMMQKESVRARLETGISFTEFAYMLVQAYDYWHLFRTEGCELQMGGSDQWGNITAGIELVSRREGAQVHALVFPLLTTASGAKFGKSEEGNVWLDPERTSPYQFYQFWLNTEDADALRLLRLFTFLPEEEIAAVMKEHTADPGRRHAQRALARDITERVHGRKAMEEAVGTSEALFGRKASLSLGAVLQAAQASPTCELETGEFGEGMTLVDVLVRCKLARSKADARRGIQGKGYYVNEVQVEDVNFRLNPQHLQQAANQRFILLRKGKKNYVRLVIR